MALAVALAAPLSNLPRLLAAPLSEPPSPLAALLSDPPCFGDIPQTGDAHVAQATALAAFGNYAFVLQNLARSATDCNGIESYCVYWCLSLIDYYEASGDKASLAQYTPNVADKLEHAYAVFDDLRTGLTFFGWDDRLGSGFMNASYMETQWDFRFLVLRAWSDWAATMSVAGNATGAEHFRGYVAETSAWLRAQLGGDLWPSQLGTHAAAEAVNAPGFATAAEVSAILATQLDDAVHICSLSNFNQFVTRDGARVARSRCP